MNQTKGMSSYTIFARQIGLVGIAQTAIRMKGLILLPILAKTLGAADYGIWSLILVTIALLQPFVVLGLDNSILRFLASKEKYEITQSIITAFLIILITGTILSLLIFASADFIAITLLKSPSASSIIKIASPLLILTSLNTIAVGSFRIFSRIKWYFYVVLLQTGLEIGLISFFIVSGHDLIYAIISLLIAGLITFGISLYLIISHTGFATPNFSRFKNYFKYGLPLVPTVIFEFVISSSDRYIIGYYAGAEKVGIYSAAYGIGGTILVCSAYIVYVLRPTLYRLFDEKKKDTVKVYLSQSCRYILMFSIPSAFGLSVLSKPLLSALTIQDFVNEGGIIIPLIAFSSVLYGLEIIFGEVINLFKRTHIFFISFSIIAIINIVLNIFFVPNFGIIGAAITTFIAYCILVTVISYKSRKYMKFELNANFIVKSIFASSIMSILIWFINPTSVFSILISILIGIFTYFSILLLLKGFQKEELIHMLEAIGLKKTM